ncbi:MAG: hypothetical protein ABH950_08650 [Candidatus Altiarchaeota archaeon]
MKPRNPFRFNVFLSLILVALIPCVLAEPLTLWGYVVKEQCKDVGGGFFTPSLNTLVVEDIDGVPGKEILIGTCQGLTILDMNGRFFGKYFTRENVYSILAADINGDRELEIVLGGEDDVSVVTTSGMLLWKKGIGERVLSFDAADLDGDGQLEIIAALSSPNPKSEDLTEMWGSVIVFTSEGEIFWRNSFKDFILQVEASRNLGTGKTDVVARGYNGLYILDSFGKLRNKTEIFPPPKKYNAEHIGDRSLEYWLGGKIPVEDLNGDGVFEVIVVEESSIAFVGLEGGVKQRISTLGLNITPLEVIILPVSGSTQKEVWISGSGEEVYSIDSSFLVQQKADMRSILEMTALQYAFADLDSDNNTDIVGIGIFSEFYDKLLRPGQKLDPSSKFITENEPQKIYAYVYYPTVHKVNHLDISKKFTPQALEFRLFGGLDVHDLNVDGHKEVLLFFQDGLIEMRTHYGGDSYPPDSSTTSTIYVPTSATDGSGTIPSLPLPDKDFFEKYGKGVNFKLLLMFVVPLSLILVWDLLSRGSKRRGDHRKKKKKTKKSQFYDLCEPQTRNHFIDLDDKIREAMKSKKLLIEKFDSGKMTQEKFTLARIDIDYELEDLVEQKQKLLEREENQIIFTINDLEQEVADNKELDIIYYQSESNRLQELLDELRKDKENTKNLKKKIVE